MRQSPDVSCRSSRTGTSSAGMPRACPERASKCVSFLQPLFQSQLRDLPLLLSRFAQVRSQDHSAACAAKSPESQRAVLPVAHTIKIRPKALARIPDSLPPARSLTASPAARRISLLLRRPRRGLCLRGQLPRAFRRFADGFETLRPIALAQIAPDLRRTPPAAQLHPQAAFAPPFAAPTLANRSKAESHTPLHPTAVDSSAPALHSWLSAGCAQLFEKLSDQITRHRRAISRRGSNVVDRQDFRRRGFSRQQQTDAGSMRLPDQNPFRLGQTKRHRRNASDRDAHVAQSLRFQRGPAPRRRPSRSPARCAFPPCACRKHIPQNFRGTHIARINSSGASSVFL